MTEEQIAEAREICDKATEGPWKSIGFHITASNKLDFEWVSKFDYDNFFEDLKFIAASRALLPQALDEIERLRGENQRLREALKGLEYDGCFCDVAIGNPMMTSHSDACVINARKALQGDDGD